MAEPTTNPSTYKPALLNKRLVIFLIVFLLVLKVAQSLTLSVAPTRASDLTVENILQAVNKERQLRNLVTLNTDSRLAGAAQYKSQDMINRNYFAHLDPDGNYIWKKIENLGYKPYSQLGENLAIEFYGTDSLMNAWMDSPTHRANILKDGFRDQGAGLAFGSAGQYRSAVANTFGALITPVIKPAPAAPPPPAPSPAPAKTPIAKQPALKKKIAAPPPPVKSAQAPINPPPAATPPPSPPTTTPASPAQAAATPPPAAPAELKPREGYGSAAATATQKKLPTSPAAGQPAVRTAAPVFAETEQIGELKKYFQVNRIFILIFGLALLFILARDSRRAYRHKLDFLDKKMNNLVLLFISLVAVALLYWL